MGALGGGLRAIWAPKAVWHGKKKPDDQKMTASGLPFGVPCSVDFKMLFGFADVSERESTAGPPHFEKLKLLTRMMVS